MHPSIVKAIDEIDAAIFSGDTFEDKRYRAQLRGQMARWERGLVSMDKMDEELKETL